MMIFMCKLTMIIALFQVKL